MKSLIIDGNNLIHRVYWVCKLNPDASPTLHVEMFLNSIKKYTEMFSPDTTFMCWDEKLEEQQNVRHALNPNYKGNRSKDEAALEVYSQTDTIKQLVEALGIRNLFPSRYEADDIMCHLVQYIPGSHTIVTVDKDLYQLVNQKVCVYNPIRKVEITEHNFKDIVGCDIEQFVTIKALKGDMSDNVSGLKGFGDKKIQKYFNGEVTLTTEQQEVVNTNLKIMDLLQGGVSCDIETEYIKRQLAVPITSNLDKFISICKDLKFEKILQNKYKWDELFFFKDQYTSLLTNLFV